MDTASSLADPSLSVCPADLAPRIGCAAAPLLIDVRRAPRYDTADRLLAGAIRCAPQDIAALAAGMAPREAVVYCVYGHEVSRQAAATLRQAGWPARWLQGGIEGGEDGVDHAGAIAQWRARPLPTIRKRLDLGVGSGRPSRWITRERPRIDRIACPWLVRRFIDPRAEFFYVPASQVMDQARSLQAVPYDLPGAPIGDGGGQCSFDALLAAFAPDAPGLDLLARIVRGADTGRLALAPQSAGLLAVSLGLSCLHAQDDHAMLAAALPVYDALYAWCRQARGGPRQPVAPAVLRAVP